MRTRSFIGGLFLSAAFVGGVDACAAFGASPASAAPDASVDAAAPVPPSDDGGPKPLGDGDLCGTCRTKHCDDMSRCDPLVFTTTEEYAGDLGAGSDGGLARADALCQAAAGGPGVFRAWLSDSKTDALTRITTGGTSTRPLRLSDGDTIAAPSLDALLNDGVQNPINQDVHGGAIPTGAYVWTATRPNGNKHQADCVDWTTLTGASGLVGVIGPVGPDAGQTWTQNQTVSCSATAHLYCFEIVP